MKQIFFTILSLSLLQGFMINAAAEVAEMSAEEYKSQMEDNQKKHQTEQAEIRAAAESRDAEIEEKRLKDHAEHANAIKEKRNNVKGVGSVVGDAVDQHELNQDDVDAAHHQINVEDEKGKAKINKAANAARATSTTDLQNALNEATKTRDAANAETTEKYTSQNVLSELAKSDKPYHDVIEKQNAHTVKSEEVKKSLLQDAPDEKVALDKKSEKLNELSKDIVAAQDKTADSDTYENLNPVQKFFHWVDGLFNDRSSVDGRDFTSTKVTIADMVDRLKTLTPAEREQALETIKDHVKDMDKKTKDDVVNKATIAVKLLNGTK